VLQIDIIAYWTSAGASDGCHLSLIFIINLSFSESSRDERARHKKNTLRIEPRELKAAIPRAAGGHTTGSKTETLHKSGW